MSCVGTPCYFVFPSILSFFCSYFSSFPATLSGVVNGFPWQCFPHFVFVFSCTLYPSPLPRIFFSLKSSQTKLSQKKKAPEILNADLYAEEADIWGLGCISLELLSLNFLWEQKGLLAVKVKERK